MLRTEPGVAHHIHSQHEHYNLTAETEMDTIYPRTENKAKKPSTAGSRRIFQTENRSEKSGGNFECLLQNKQTKVRLDHSLF